MTSPFRYNKKQRKSYRRQAGVPPAPGSDVDIEIDLEANQVHPK